MSGDTERQIEALLFAAAGPLSLEDLAKRLPADADVPAAVAALQKTYEGRGWSWPASPAAGASRRLRTRPS